MDNSPMPDFRFVRHDELVCVHMVHREGIAVIASAAQHSPPLAVTLPLTPQTSRSDGEHGHSHALAHLADAQEALSLWMQKAHSDDG